MVVLPKTQVLSSATFKAPPLEDETHLLPELYDWQHTHSPNHPLFIYDEAPGKLNTIYWGEAVRGFHRAAHYVASLFPSSVAQDAIEGKSVTIGTLAASGMFVLFSVYAATMLRTCPHLYQTLSRISLQKLESCVLALESSLFRLETHQMRSRIY